MVVRRLFLFLGLAGGALGMLLAPKALRAAEETSEVIQAADLLELVLEADEESARQCLATLTGLARSRQISPAQLAALRQRLSPRLATLLAAKNAHPLRLEAGLLACAWGDADGQAIARAALADGNLPLERRVLALELLAAAGDTAALDVVRPFLSEGGAEAEVQSALLAGLARFESPAAAEAIAAAYANLPAAARAQAVEVLTRRVAWARILLREIAAGKIPAGAVSANQALRLLETNDEELKKLVTAAWGTLRTERDPGREQVIANLKSLLTQTPGNAERGEALFAKLCAQCHKIHNVGAEVGPDITLNGRASYEQLLSNVFDPSLVIGAGYQAQIVTTVDGQTFTGLVAEDNAQRIVLKLQGGKLVTLARDDVERVTISDLSLMPEGIEKQYAPQELADLFAFLVWEKRPGETPNRKIPGAP